MGTACELTPDQIAAKRAIDSGADIFLTGAPGTGKTHLIKALLSEYEGSGRKAICCAPTGLAAVMIGGATIQRVFNFGSGPAITGGMKLMRHIPKALLAADTVIIDEISMVRTDIFDSALSSVAAVEKKTGRKMQVICVGDFLQLPAFYGNAGIRTITEAFYGRPIKAPWAFAGNEWDARDFTNIVLKDIVRQQDEEFLQVLNRIRCGDTEAISTINRKSNPDPFPDAPSLFARRRDVDLYNAQQISALQGKEYIINTYEAGFLNEAERSDIPGALRLKVGARVMITANAIPGKGSAPYYCNGSLGIVTAINSDPEHPVDDSVTVLIDGQTRPVIMRRQRVPIFDYAFDGEAKFVKRAAASYSQIPVVPAYAMTIHKSQGQTFDHLNIDPSGCFSAGQLYTALSRVQDISRLHLIHAIEPQNLIIDPSALSFTESLQDDIKCFL